MIEQHGIHQKLNEIFARKLNLDVPSIDTDLVGTGLLDSLTLLELLTYLDETFGVSISPEELELENLRSIASIAGVVAQRTAKSNQETLGHAAVQYREPYAPS